MVEKICGTLTQLRLIDCLLTKHISNVGLLCAALLDDLCSLLLGGGLRSGDIGLLSRQLS